MEEYSRGLRGRSAKALARVTEAWIRIPPPPPNNMDK